MSSGTEREMEVLNLNLNAVSNRKIEYLSRFSGSCCVTQQNLGFVVVVDLGSFVKNQCQKIDFQSCLEK